MTNDYDRKRTLRMCKDIEEEMNDPLWEWENYCPANNRFWLPTELPKNDKWTQGVIEQKRWILGQTAWQRTTTQCLPTKQQKLITTKM